MAWDIQANDFNQSIGNPNHGKMDLTNENWDEEFCSINLFPIFWMVVNMPANFDVKKQVESDTNRRRGKRYQQIMGCKKEIGGQWFHFAFLVLRPFFGGTVIASMMFNSSAVGGDAGNGWFNRQPNLHSKVTLHT